MLLILELAMLGGGLYAIHTGKIPNFLLGGGRYRINEGAARFIGLLMILPLPCSFGVGFLSAYSYSSESIWESAIFIEAGITIGLAILVLIVYVIFRDPAPVEASGLTFEKGSVITANEQVITIDDIAYKIRHSRILTIMGIFPFMTPITCPIAIIQTTKALKLIDEYRIGEEYRKKARNTRAAAIFFFSIFVLNVGFWMYILLFLNR